MSYRTTYGDFPTASAFLFGLGFGGGFDGIVFHQMLQWHHMVSAWYPPTTLENLRIDALWDGLFHTVTDLFVGWGIALFWRKASTRELYWSLEMLAGGMLVGWGTFNLVEGLIDHSLLGVHHANETVPVSQQPYWDLAFLAWGLSMLVGGLALQRLARRRRRLPRRPIVAKPKPRRETLDLRNARFHGALALAAFVDIAILVVAASASRCSRHGAATWASTRRAAVPPRCYGAAPAASSR